VLVFSLKAGKLKSRVTGHLADVHKLAYCRQADQIASVSSEFCFIHAQKTLAHVKTIKCSTSSFVDCQFALTGSLFVTSFKDGSVLLWDPVSWNHRSSAVIERSPKVALGDGPVLAVYSSKKLWLCDTTH
jgi:WD40 repeat protein